MAYLTRMISCCVGDGRGAEASCWKAENATQLAANDFFR